MKSPDVIIIGAGIIGCATAFELSKHGYQTLNIDKLGQPGAGSTINSCAIVRLSYSTYDGIALAYEGIRYWQNWSDYLEVDDPSGLAKFVSNGSLIIRSPDERLGKMLGIFDQIGVEYEDWDRDRLAREMPIISIDSHHPPTRMDDERFWDEAGAQIDGALFVKDCGYISDPQLATHNLMVAAQNYGAEFIFNETVTEILQAGGRVTGITL